MLEGLSTCSEKSVRCATVCPISAFPRNWEFSIGAKLLLFVALGIELLEVCPQVFRLLFVLDTGEYHFGAQNLRSWIFDVFFKGHDEALKDL